MQIDSIQDSTRYVVSGIHHGAILPGKREEMTRNVFLLPGADVRGGVWANELQIKGGPVRVTESVYSHGPITISDDEDGSKMGQVEFGSTVTTPDSLIAQGKRHHIRCYSDIYGGKLNLSNAIVLGNVFASQAVIQNSIILGGVFCQGKLNVRNSMISTFRSKSVELGEGVFLFFPFALAEEPILVPKPVKALTFFSLQQKLGGKTKGQGAISMDQDDVFELYEKAPAGDDSQPTERPLPTRMFCLSVTERILDVSEIGKHFQFNRRFLENMALYNHISPEHREAEHVKPFAELEKQLWLILENHDKLSEVDGTSDLHKLFMRDDVRQYVNPSPAKED